jgi:Uma2 family endonuclease
MAMRHPPLPVRGTWTVADLEQLPDDGKRYGILHGELFVTPPPSLGHQGIAMELAFLLKGWCLANAPWTVLAPGGIYMTEKDWCEPDVCVYTVPHSGGRTWRDLPPPILAVEILSPSTARRDRKQKRPAYLTHGVREVWLIDERTRTVERWTTASDTPEVMQATITWTPDPTLPTLVIQEAELFGPPM